MARDNRIRLSDDEHERLKEARVELYGEETAEEIPLGRVVDHLCDLLLVDADGK